MFGTRALPRSVYPSLFNHYGGTRNYFGNHIDNVVRIHAATARQCETTFPAPFFQQTEAATVVNWRYRTPMASNASSSSPTTW